MALGVILLLCMISANLDVTSAGQNVDTYWKKLNMVNVIKDVQRLEQSGFEYDRKYHNVAPHGTAYNTLYLCRGKNGAGKTVPGKFFLRSYINAKIYCNFPGGDKTYYRVNDDSKDNVEILTIPTEWVSWVSSTKNLDHAIDAGDGSMICRVRTDDTVHVGLYHDDTKKCEYVFYDVLSDGDTIEILTLNMLGRKKLNV